MCGWVVPIYLAIDVGRDRFRVGAKVFKAHQVRDVCLEGEWSVMTKNAEVWERRASRTVSVEDTEMLNPCSSSHLAAMSRINCL